MEKNRSFIAGFTLAFCGIFNLNSCVSIPKNAKPFENFEVNRYLGTWFEIARFDFRFEKNLDNTAAQYSLDSRGNVKLLNSGHNFKTGKWRSAEGVAKFRKNKTTAALKVSFFGPFYSGYNVIALDSNYQYALIAGNNLDYLWFLSRTKTMPEDIKKDYLRIAQELGYDTSKLIWVKQDKESPFEYEK